MAGSIDYGVLDAPDQRLREITIKARAGLPLNNQDVRRLAQRQGVEIQSAQAAVPFVAQPEQAAAAAVPVSVDQQLVGTGLDQQQANVSRVLRDAQVRQANAAATLADFQTSPLATTVRTQQAVDYLDPVGAELRQYGLGEYAGSPDAASALENERAARRYAEQNGVTVDVARAQMAPVVVGQTPLTGALASEQVAAPGVAANAFFTPPIPDAGSSVSESVDPVAQIRGQVFKGTEQDRASAVRNWADTQFNALFSGQTLSTAQAAKAKAAITAQGLERSQTKINYTDPRTKHVMELDVVKDGAGNVLQVSNSPRITERNVATDALDKKYADDYQQWVTIGKPVAERAIDGLSQALENLGAAGFAADWQSGSFAGLPPARFLSRMFSDKPQETRRLVEQTVMKTLRETLGGQFSEKEGKRLLENAFDPYASEEVNARFVAALLEETQAAAQAKQQQADYFEKYGTIGGYQGPKLAGSVEQIESRINSRLGRPTSGSQTRPGAGGVAPNDATKQAIDAWINSAAD